MHITEFQPQFASGDMLGAWHAPRAPKRLSAMERAAVLRLLGTAPRRSTTRATLAALLPRWLQLEPLAPGERRRRCLAFIEALLAAIEGEARAPSDAETMQVLQALAALRDGRVRTALAFCEEALRTPDALQRVLAGAGAPTGLAQLRRAVALTGANA